MNYVNQFLFGIYPYVALAVFLLGSLIRFDREQYTWKSDSSQLLRARELRWGSNLFHIGVLFIFVGHLFGLLAPHSSYAWLMSAGAKQILAMASGGIAGVLLTPQHLQAQDRFLEDLLQFQVASLTFAPWGFHQLVIDREALADGTIALSGAITNDLLSDPPAGADPFALPGEEKVKLAVLKDAEKWSTNIGHPGPANPAEGEVFATFVLPNMLANAARGMKAETAVEQAELLTKTIFAKWRKKGLIGGKV